MTGGHRHEEKFHLTPSHFLRNVMKLVVLQVYSTFIHTLLRCQLATRYMQCGFHNPDTTGAGTIEVF